MGKQRLEAFSDGVIAIIITIMVLELKVPHAADAAALRELAPELCSYIVSFVYVGIYWNNHHHLLHAATGVDGKIMWANLHLLFWLSLIPFGTAWIGQNPEAAGPTALCGVLLLMAGVAYYVLQQALVAHEGPDSRLARALGPDYKGKLSPALYAAAIALAFVSHWLSVAIYVGVAVLWLVPDRRLAHPGAERET